MWSVQEALKAYWVRVRLTYVQYDIEAFTQNLRFLFKSKHRIDLRAEQDLHRILNTDICPTGALLLACFTLIGASHQLRRFIAL